ncbi:hypothetical protein QJS10_CPB11g02275 [Acorus calamus]|uniref:Uncharacterized protein n=1 Tax=Acorus calamus TaxID=4465 RepID=A0AAV9DPI9_ACOCL|nr:hypothetical protein QJS10_CPB11g02275 [Acorus calamus]
MDVDAMGSMSRIKKLAHELLTIGEMGDDDESWQLMETDLSLKSFFFYSDFNRLISGTPDEVRKLELTDLANDLIYYLEQLNNAVKSRSIPQTQECYADAAAVLQDVMTVLITPSDFEDEDDPPC